MRGKSGDSPPASRVRAHGEGVRGTDACTPPAVTGRLQALHLARSAV